MSDLATQFLDQQAQVATSPLGAGISTSVKGPKPAFQNAPTDQANQVANYLNSPNMVLAQKPAQPNPVMSWIGRLFDTTDQADNPVEWAWDGFLRTMQWGYDRVNQAAVYGLAALPGGTQTLSWDQANHVSVGQEVVGSLLYDYNALTGNKGFDITNAADRKRIFEDNLAGKLASGAVDVGAMMFADPYMVLGKAAKIGRLRYLDTPYTPEKLAAAIPHVEEQLKNLATIPEKDWHPLTQLSVFVSRKNEAGKPIRTLQEIMQHPVLRNATNPEEMASMLLSADNPEQSFQAIRYMLGDVSVLPQLRSERADLFLEINRQQQKALEGKMLHRPQDHAKMVADYSKQMDDAHYELQRTYQTSRHGMADETQLASAHAKMDTAIENYRMVRDMQFPDPLSRKAKMAGGIQQQTAQAAIDQMTQRDVFFQKMLGEEQSHADNVTNGLFGAFNRDNAETSWMQLIPGRKVDTNGAKGIPLDTAFGRAVEASRERRAIAAGQQAQTKGQWAANYFQANPASRVLTLWRWLGNENPSGYIVTDGIGSQNSYRELAATANDVHALSGEPRMVTETVQQKVKVKTKVDGKTQTKTVLQDVPVQKAVGGVALKDQLLQKYVQTWTNSGALDQVARHKVLQDFESDIIRNMGEYHGLSADDTDIILRKLQMERQGLIEEIKNGKGYWTENGKIHRAPFLESQLQNGMYLLDFRKIEKAMEKFGATGRSAAWNETKSFAADHAANLYDEFQSLWRPSVLLRLGYTQRNVVEGIIRATAFMFSLDPAHMAAPLFDAFRQAPKGLRNIVAPKFTEHIAEKAAESGIDPAPLIHWTDKQRRAGVDALNRVAASMELLKAKRADALALGDTVGVQRYDRFLQQSRQMQDGYRTTLKLLDDRGARLALYRQQGRMKQSVYSGETSVAGYAMDQAFAGDTYSQVAMANASSNHTRQFESSIAMKSSESVMRDMMLSTNRAVSPDDVEHYFPALSDAIRQFKTDDVGKMIVNGAKPQQIASYLRNTALGRERAGMLGLNVPKGSEKFSVDSWDEAIGYAKQMIHRYESLTVTPELRSVLRNSHPTDAVLKQYLDGNAGLIPVVGDIAEELGHSNLLNMSKKIAQIGFKWLGTIPEDSFVRIPFYGRRHQIALDSLMSDLVKQVGDNVTVRDTMRIQQIAHARALADTKKWLYTIERRTNLGKIGEHVFPFISASQNSVTTFGRLIWNDPRIAVALAGLWNAPQKMHIEDSQGNIVLAFPLDLIPQGIKEKVGLDNMLNMKISKNGLNVLFQMNGENPIPSPGPLVTLPASEMMKHGWFGQSIDAPGILKQALGEKQANALWDGWKTYLFGANQGVSENFASYDMIFPPWLQKAIQMKEGELNSVQYATQYALQMRTEQAKYLAGYRETMPTADEIKTRTNNLYWMRILGNLTAFTPPQYTSKLQPLIDVMKANKQAYGLAGDKMNSEMFGDYLTMLGDFSITKNVAGAQSNIVAYANARKYEGLIGRIAPEVGSDMNTLGIILNNGNVSNALYDPSVHAWQQATNIPGVAEKYRAMQSPQESMVESQKNAGWVAYIKGVDVLDAVLRQRGLKSYRSAGAADLAMAKQQLITRLSGDPAYAGWYADYSSFGSTKTMNSVKVITAALNDHQFAKDNANSGMWQAAQQYLIARDEMLAGRITQVQWDSIRSDLQASNTEWAALANRYLTNDDKPVDVGVSFGMMGG